MKKYLTHIILALSLLLPFTGYAACSLDETSSTKFLTDCSQEQNGFINPSDTVSTTTGIQQRVGEIATGAISLWALLAVGAIVWAGIQYTKSFGDDEKLKKAKTTGIYAVIGLILMMLSFSLVDVIINFIFKITWSN